MYLCNEVFDVERALSFGFVDEAHCGVTLTKQEALALAVMLADCPMRALCQGASQNLRLVLSESWLAEEHLAHTLCVFAGGFKHAKHMASMSEFTGSTHRWLEVAGRFAPAVAELKLNAGTVTEPVSYTHLTLPTICSV
eukprot:6292761-Prymnesium_polylepis.1